MKSPAEMSSSAIPTVSVIVPAYNAAEYIGEALKSVLNQTFQSHEIIIINDGSPDTSELERALEPHRSNIRYLKQENRGAAAARNSGLREATGEFIAFLDADDTWLPSFLEEQLELLRRNSAQIVYSDALLVGDSPLAGRTFMEVQPSHGAVTPESLLGGEVTVLTSTVLASRKLVFDAGLFDETIRRGHDFDLWLRMAKIGAQFAYQRKVLAHHRILENSLSGGTVSQLGRTLAVLRKIEDKVQLTATEKDAFNRTFNRTLAQLAIEKGKEKLLAKEFDSAARSFEEARRLKDSWKLKASCIALRIAPSVLWRLYRRRA